MFRVQYKARSPYEQWITVGSYGSEQQAISMALSRKLKGAIIVRVLNKKGAVVYSN